MRSTIEHCERLVDHGIALMPVHEPVGVNACSCGNPSCASVGKHPRTKHGLLDATRDLAVVREWIRTWPKMNVGIVTGSISGGLVALDVDVSESKRGDVVLVGLVRDRGPIPWSWESLTGGHGAHHFLVAPPCVRVPCSRSRIGLGLDVRGEGGYVVAPPSLHANGNRYSWVENGAPLATLDGWLLEAMVGGTDPEPNRKPIADVGYYGSETDLERRVRRAVAYVDRMDPSIAGAGGHDAAWRVALRLVRGFELPPDVAIHVMAHFNRRCSPPWSERELRHKVESAARMSRIEPGFMGAA